VVFSVREAEQGEKQAADKAWEEVVRRLRDLSSTHPGRVFDLVEVSYDPLPGQSVIEELPDLPKSSRPQAVEVAVRVRATYALRSR
jgi:hypothetical protein